MNIPSNFLLIPITGDKENEAFNISLDGSTFTMRFDFVHRYKAWYLTLFSSVGEKLFKIKMRSMSFPGEYTTSPEMPLGAFFCVNTVDPKTEPDLYNFGINKDVKLYYVANVS